MFADRSARSAHVGFPYQRASSERCVEVACPKTAHVALSGTGFPFRCSYRSSIEGISPADLLSPLRKGQGAHFSTHRSPSFPLLIFFSSFTTFSPTSPYPFFTQSSLISYSNFFILLTAPLLTAFSSDTLAAQSSLVHFLFPFVLSCLLFFITFLHEDLAHGSSM